MSIEEMTHDDIIRMAKEAGLWPAVTDVFPKELERFAALVAEHEREAVINLLKGIDKDECEDPDGWWETSSGAEFGASILETIRARGKE